MDVQPGLPRWDLGDLYPGPESAELRRDFERLEQKVKDFRKRYEGRIKALDADGLIGALRTYEEIQEEIGRIISYAGLLYAGDMTDLDITRFYQNCQERINALSTELIFFALEINRIDEAALEEKIARHDALKHYRPWFERVRAFRPYQLDDSLEKLFHEKEVTGRDALTRLFDETLAALTFDIKGEQRSLEQTLDLFSHPEEDHRRTAAQALGDTFAENSRLFTLITNTLIKDKETEDRWRGFQSPEASRHLANQVEPEVVDALAAAVKEAYPRLSHRYYALKAKWMGKDKLAYWDRNAPLPDDDDNEITWPQAQATVLDAYRSFSPQMAELAARFFDNDWIDAQPRPGKAPGAFSHGTVPSVHPYILLNYLNKPRDVMTLAHELGHGIHQLLAAPQGMLLADTPLTLAETASVFGEMLTFQRLLENEKTARRRRILLAAKVEDMLNTVVRQIAFHEFEREVHNKRRGGELTLQEIGELWMQTQAESLGPAVVLSEGYEYYWMYIPHFVHVPFYVYAYAFGDCLVNSLYDVYLSQPDGFERKYLDLLRAGGSKTYDELLSPFGLDAKDPEFWSRGLSVISGMIDKLERDEEL